jgi:signal peptidase II
VADALSHLCSGGQLWQHTIPQGGLTLSRLQRFVLIGAIALLCIISDRITKDLAQRTLSQSGPRMLLGGVVTLTYAENRGAFLGLGARLPSSLRFALSLLANAVIVTWGLVLTLRVSSIGTLRLASVALLVGGGIGNLIDRVMNGGAVIDFMVLSLGPVQTGVFNVADLAVVGGALALAVLAFWEGNRTKMHGIQHSAGQDGDPIAGSH